MPSATIQISDALTELALARAAASGHASLDEYVQALILADVELPITPELEAHLLSALETPAREITAIEWERKRRELGSSQTRNAQ